MVRVCINGYKCITCNENFANEIELSNHLSHQNLETGECNSLRSSLDNLVNMVNDLTCRMDKLEQENTELRKKLSTRKSESTINELLESYPPPSISLKDWVESLLSQVPIHLEVVFNDSLLDGINSIFKDNIETLPIIAFKKKSGAFYYYDDIKGWTLLDTSEFDNIVGRISYRFLVSFNRDWYQPNLENIKNSEEYKNMYNSYYMKILGGTKMSDESRQNHVRNAFYKLIKQ